MNFQRWLQNIKDKTLWTMDNVKTVYPPQKQFAWVYNTLLAYLTIHPRCFIYSWITGLFLSNWFAFSIWPLWVTWWWTQFTLNGMLYLVIFSFAGPQSAEGLADSFNLCKYNKTFLLNPFHPVRWSIPDTLKNKVRNCPLSVLRDCQSTFPYKDSDYFYLSK